MGSRGRGVVKKAFITVVYSALLATAANAADVPSMPPAEVPIAKPQPPVIPPWEFEGGLRYWYSSAKYQWDLQGLAGGTDSRLTYNGLTAHSAEAFWRINHASGLFAKGYIGGGSVVEGHLNDEDFPPAVTPYSNAIAVQRNGSLKYLSADLGYTFWQDPNYQLGVFIGYHYWNERLNTFGCTQLAGNAAICGDTPPVFGPVAANVNVLDNDATWNSLRLGMNGETMLMPGLKLSGEVNYVRGYVNANDLHNLRPDIRPLAIDGNGGGIQTEVILSSNLTSALSVGLGARWWHIRTVGNARFEQTSAGGQPQPVKMTEDRYGIFVQAAYKLGEPLVPATIGAANPQPSLAADRWAGPYAGLSTGYGSSQSETTFTPKSANATFAILTADAPSSLHVENAGFLGGGQLGYNWQAGSLVFGLEADIAYANIGSTTATTSIFGTTTTTDQKIGWLGTARVRIGKAATEALLVYATGGVAFGNTSLSVDQREPGINCPFNFVCSSGSVSGISVGWTAGAGVEYAISNHLTLKGEYLYADLGSRTVTMTDTGFFAGSAPFIYAVKADFNLNILRMGLNYRF
jgi:opacity protein-like surface antigen